MITKRHFLLFQLFPNQTFDLLEEECEGNCLHHKCLFLLLKEKVQRSSKLIVLTLSAHSPHVDDVLSVLCHTEQVDDGVPHHRDDGGPEQEHLILQLVRSLVGDADALRGVDDVSELKNIN